MEDVVGFFASRISRRMLRKKLLEQHKGAIQKDIEISPPAFHLKIERIIFESLIPFLSAGLLIMSTEQSLLSCLLY